MIFIPFLVCSVESLRTTSLLAVFYLYLSPPTVGGAPEVQGTVGLTVLIAGVIAFIFV